MNVADTGLSAQHIEKIRATLRSHPRVKSAILYGSRAMGTYKPGSDIDLTLRGETLTLTDLLRIENDLDDQMLPYKIDLSLYHKIDNQDLLSHIDEVGIEFYNALHS